MNYARMTKAQLIKEAETLRERVRALQKVKTERNLAGQALHESEERYRNLVEKMIDIIYTLDTEGTITSSNRAVKNILGFEPQDVIGRKFAELIPEEALPHAVAAFTRVLEGSDVTAETILVGKDGKPHDVEFSSTPIVRDGKVVGTRGIVRDITERKRGRERLRVAAESLSDVIYEWDMKDQLDWFGKIDELLGYAPNEFPRTWVAWAELLHPEDRDAVMAAIDTHLKTGAPYDVEYRIRRKDGTWRCWLARGRALRDAKGVPYRWIGTVSDITERKKAEDDLRRMRDQIDSILASVEDVIWSATADGQKTLFMSKAAERVYGRRPEEFLENVNIWLEVIHPEDRHLFADHMGELYRTGHGEYEYRIVRPDGSIAWVSARVSLVCDQSGQPIRIDGIVSDITERKNAEEALRESEEKYRSLVANIPDVTWTADSGGNTTFISSKVKDVVGYTPEEVCAGGVWFERIHPDDRDMMLKAYEALFNEGKKYDVEYRYRRKDGKYIWLHESAMSIYEKDGKKYTDGVFTDITQHKEAEEALRKLEAEKMIVKELKELDRMKNEFVETVTHELRTPMTPLKSTLEMFLDGTLGQITPQQKEYIEMMSRNVERLSRFTTDVLSLSRLDSGAYDLRPQEMSVFSVARPAIELLKKRAEMKNISLSLLVRTEIFAFADPDAVSEIITNLVNNAVVHCPEGTKVSVFSRVLGDDFIEVSVADNGPGIPESMVEKIFDKFFQAKRTRGPGYKGAGVGLTICRALVEKMGGKICVESEPGKGSVFRFTLPTRRITESQALR